MSVHCIFCIMHQRHTFLYNIFPFNSGLIAHFPKNGRIGSAVWRRFCAYEADSGTVCWMMHVLHTRPAAFKDALHIIATQLDISRFILHCFFFLSSLPDCVYCQTFIIYPVFKYMHTGNVHVSQKERKRKFSCLPYMCVFFRERKGKTKWKERKPCASSNVASLTP